MAGRHGEVKYFYQPHTTMIFQPKKKGDVGHDLLSALEFSEMGRFERLVARLLKIKIPMFIIWPFRIRSIRTEMHLAMPSSTWAQIVARSSAAKRMILIVGGIIDSGYTGELYTVLHNVGFIPRIIKRGDRYAQVIFFQAHRPKMEQIGPRRFIQFQEWSERAGTGFGSTGT